MRTSILMTAVCLLSAAAGAEDRAAAGGRGSEISVIGVASAQVKPSVVEIGATLSAEGELANDARVKERDARQKVIDTMKTRAPEVALEFRGISVNPVFDASAIAMARQQQIMIQNGMVVQMQQNQQQDIPRRYGVTEQVRLVLKDTDKLDAAKLVETVVRLIDIARESGLSVGQLNINNVTSYSSTSIQPPPPLIVCKASNGATVREEAYKAAMEDARKKASALAGIAGVKIGKVVGVEEMEAGGQGAQSSQTGQAAQKGTEAAISSELVGELSLNVRLGVRFEIVN